MAHVTFLLAAAALLPSALAGTCTLHSAAARPIDDAFKSYNNTSRAHKGRPCAEEPCPTSPLGPYKDVRFDKIKNVPGLKQSGTHSASIIFPAEALSGTVFPVLSWGHATFIGSISPGTNTASVPAIG